MLQTFLDPSSTPGRKSPASQGAHSLGLRYRHLSSSLCGAFWRRGVKTEMGTSMMVFFLLVLVKFW